MKKLKILLVSQYPFSNSFGVGKVHFDLKREFEFMGHQVDTLSSDDYYPNGQSTFSKLIGPLYTYKILSKLKKIAHQYDIIDANSECIPFPKKEFGFRGLLIYRSHGLPPVYEKAELRSEYQLMIKANQQKIKFKTRFGNIYRMFLKKPGDQEFLNSIKNADIVHCLNREEYDFLREYGVAENKILLLPNGIANEYINSANKIESGNKKNILSFVGSWTIRKGIKDLNEILSIINQETTIDRFDFLGGCTTPENVYSDFNYEFKHLLNIIPRYSQNELISLIKTSKVGVFPSYMEGLPLAIIEQLACGIPVVAYEIPGVLDVLKDIDSTLLIKPGDKRSFGDKVIEILKMSELEYTMLSEKCKAKSQEYLMSKISLSFIEEYKKNLRLL